MRLIQIFIFFVVFTFSCAKKKPEKNILGRWEITNVDTAYGSSRPDLFEAFQNDRSYCKEMTFYEDGTIFFDFVNTSPVLGNYKLEYGVGGPKTIALLKLEHFPLDDTTQIGNFSFRKMSFFIMEFTRNKMLLTSNVAEDMPKHWKYLEFELEKTGKFD